MTDTRVKRQRTPTPMLMLPLVRVYFPTSVSQKSDVLYNLGCVLYHYGLTQFKVYYPRVPLICFFTFHSGSDDLTYCSTTPSSSVFQEVCCPTSRRFPLCVLTGSFFFTILALGCVTQLVWARGTLSRVGRPDKDPYVLGTPQPLASPLSVPSVSVSQSRLY